MEMGVGGGLAAAAALMMETHPFWNRRSRIFPQALASCMP